MASEFSADLRELHFDIPTIKADKTPREFRHQSNLNWVTFTKVWLHVRAFVSAPSNDTMCHPSDSEPYHTKLSELANDILQTRYFGPESRGNWVFGKYTPEPHLEAYVSPPPFIAANANKR